MNELIIKSEIKENTVSIPLSFIKNAVKQSLSIEVVTDSGSMYLVLRNLIDLIPVDEDDEDYKILRLPFNKTDSSLSKWDLLMLTRFHYHWFNLLREELSEDRFKPILEKVAESRKNNKIYPSKEKMLEMFSHDPTTLKLVILGKSPKESEIGMWEPYVERFHKRGILWLNTVLTEYEELPFEHSEWIPFIKAVISKLDLPTIITSIEQRSYHPKPLMCLGLTIGSMDLLSNTLR